MTRTTASIAASVTPKKTAREKWQGATTTRQTLKAQLLTMCARPSFCMYCYESRGTDVDHFTPISHDPLRTFDWANHILACGFCNQQAKKEKFPLDAAKNPLLLDPSIADSADHMTMASTGEFIDLTPQGKETIDVLRLNTRSELVDARHRSWRGVIRLFKTAAEDRRSLDADDVEDLRFLPVVDAFHHFAHDIRTGRLAAKAVDPNVTTYALRNISVIQSIFPRCNL